MPTSLYDSCKDRRSLSWASPRRFRNEVAMPDNDRNEVVMPDHESSRRGGDNATKPSTGQTMFSCDRPNGPIAKARVLARAVMTSLGLRQTKPSLVDFRSIARMFTPAGALFTGLVVQLYSSKSTRSGGATLWYILMAATGVVLFWIFALGLWTSIRQLVHTHPLAPLFTKPWMWLSCCLLGAFLTISSFQVFADERVQIPPASPNEHTFDVDGLALRNLQTLKRGDEMRIAATAINSSDQPVSVDSIQFGAGVTVDSPCFQDSSAYSIERNIEVYEKGGVSADVLIEEGFSKGYNVAAAGSLSENCGIWEMSLQFPADTRLQPNSASAVAIDLPDRFQITRANGQALDSYQGGSQFGEEVRLKWNNPEAGLAVSIRLSTSGSDTYSCVSKVVRSPDSADSRGSSDCPS